MSRLDPIPTPPRDPVGVIRRSRTQGTPLVLSINGEAELVLRDPASYQTLLELAERAERMAAIQQSLDEIRAGQGIPAADVLAEVRQILNEPQES